MPNVIGFPGEAAGRAAPRDLVDDRTRERIRAVADRAGRVVGDLPRVLLPPRTPERLEPGQLGPPRPLPVKELGTLLRQVLAAEGRRAVWVAAGNEARVQLDRARVALADGLVIIGLTLDTDQTGPQELTTVFAVGSEKRPAGLLAVAEERPRGHSDLAATFAEAVVATCWRALLLVVTTAAASAGRDSRGEPLVAAALLATPEQLVVVTQADHRLGQRKG